MNVNNRELGPDHQLPDDRGVEGPGLLGCGDDLFSWEEEAVRPGVPELHAGGEEDAGHAVSPVHSAAAGHVQEAGDTPDIVRLAMDSLQLRLTTDSDLQHLVVVVRVSAGVAPGEEDQLTVAVDIVEEDPVPLPGHDVVADVDILDLGPGGGAVVGVAAPVIGAPALVPVMAVIPVGVHSLSL